MARTSRSSKKWPLGHEVLSGEREEDEGRFLSLDLVGSLWPIKSL